MSHIDASSDYSDQGFWSKVKSFATAAGRDVIHKSFCLYFAFNDPETPMWAKTVIAGALGYFILPVDAIPDLIPAVGYADDLGALSAAVITVTAQINTEHRQQADQRMSEWFGA